jgi:uncharacterized membrane protein YbhN (UPF0104 family)
MSDAAAVTAGGPGPVAKLTLGRRIMRIAIWLVGLAIAALIAQLAGIDLEGWLENLWDTLTSISIQYILAAFALQTVQTVLTGYAWYAILRAAYPSDRVTLWPIVTSYAAGVALNNVLPANIGTFTTLFMFVAIIPSATLPGVLAGMLVQKIFFTIAGTAVYLYLFLSVPGSFDFQLGGLTDHWLLAIGIAAGVIVLLIFLARLALAKFRKLWEKAKQGGAILARPREYLARVALPELGAWLAKLAVIAVFLAAYGIPVTVHTVMSVTGSNSIANTVSVTPGGVGVTQAANAFALEGDTDTATATAYSVGQQLVTTAWNIFFAIVLVAVVFGWQGGKQLVSGSLGQAKDKTREMKEERSRKKEEARETREEEGRRGRLGLRRRAGH